MDDLLGSGALEEEYDNQFGREDYEDEDHDAVDNYYEAMKGNGK
jgi:hypothetical protein